MCGASRPGTCTSSGRRPSTTGTATSFGSAGRSGRSWPRTSPTRLRRGASPMSWLDDWLAELEGRRSPAELDAYLLWPRTPIGDEIQDRIRERVGASDRDVADARSRPARVVALLERLRSR